MKQIMVCISLCAIALPAVAAWTVTADGAPSGCTHVISDGTWKIGVYKYSDDNWNLGKYSGANGSGYVAGSGDLDLTDVAGDCGVIIKASNNGALERIAGLTSIIFPDSLETMYGNTVAGCSHSLFKFMPIHISSALLKLKVFMSVYYISYLLLL